MHLEGLSPGEYLLVLCGGPCALPGQQVPQLKPFWGRQRVKAGESWRRGTEGASHPQGQAGGLWHRSVTFLQSHLQTIS